MGWYFPEWWGGMAVMMLIGMAFVVLFWGGIILLIVWGVKQIGGTRRETVPPPAMGRPTPLEIAKERYAKGEITKEQYEQIKKDLET